MKRVFSIILLSSTLLAQSAVQPSGHKGMDSISASAQTAQAASVTPPAADNRPRLDVTVDSSFVLEHPAAIRRISIANGDIADAVAVTPHEVLLNGKKPGETTLIIWDSNANRTSFQVNVQPSSDKVDIVRGELQKEFGQDVSLAVEDGKVFLRGTVRDMVGADRAFNIASTLGKVINLLRVVVPAAPPQILLKVRFADVDRSATSQLGLNIFSMDPTKGIGSSTTGQFGQPPTFTQSGGQVNWTISDLMNIFYYRPDLNLGTVLRDLQAKNLLQILAEPNLLTTSGQPASFLAGGEFPFPTIQGGASGVGQITVQFKEFGIKLQFLPTVTPRGTIDLMVIPEVSSLDYANGLTVSGYTIPGLSTRRVQTDVELQNGQSFVIAGLLDNQLTETLNKMPGLSNIPVLGKLFQSRALSKSNSELLVLVTPELVAPIPAGVEPPQIKMPQPFLSGTAKVAPQTPGPRVTGPVPALPKRDSMPVEELKTLQTARPISSNGTPTSTGTTGFSSMPGMPSGVPVVAAAPASNSPGNNN